MYRNGMRHWAWIGLALFLTATAYAHASTEEGAPGADFTGDMLARAALNYAHMEWMDGDDLRTGMPYVWGGRTALAEFQRALAHRDESQVGGGESADLSGLGVDASGLVVAALRDLVPDVRFFAGDGPDPVLWADATSALLFQYNSTPVEPAEARAGDMVFFGTREGDVVTVGGVAIVTGREAGRIDFVVASAGQGKVVHTFARIDGDYWRDHIVGVGRLALPAGLTAID